MIDILDIVSDGLKAVSSGGVIGLLGAIGTNVVDLFKGKSRDKTNVEIVKVGGEKAGDIIKMMAESYDHDKASYKNAGWVDSIRGLFRPTIAMYLSIVSTIITLWALKKVGLDEAIMKDLVKIGFYTCLHLTTICITWYFGVRGTSFKRR